MRELIELVNNPKLLALPKRLAKYLSIDGSRIKLIIDGSDKCYIKIKHVNSDTLQAKFDPALFRYTYINNVINIYAVDPKVLEDTSLLAEQADSIKRSDTTVEPPKPIPAALPSEPSQASSTLFVPPQPASGKDLAMLFQEIYKAELEDRIDKEENTRITISKLAGYAILAEVIEKAKKGELITSHVGRNSTVIHEAHRDMMSISGRLADNNSVSRLQFVLIENVATKQRVIVDLGSRNGTTVCFQANVTHEDFNHSFDLFNAIGNSVRKTLDKDESKRLQAICPKFAQIRSKTVEFLDKATTADMYKPDADRPVQLKTNIDNIGWLPIPPGYSFDIGLGGGIRISIKAEDQKQKSMSTASPTLNRS